ncbi:MAG TPA: hypothetical protein G4O01_01715 [Dehalococcoidia bacterium]|nr:hypothetical protein [Dehalococcoidia bacterium]
MGIGKLYKLSNEEFLTEVNYQFHDESPTSWWGELTLTDYVRLDDSESYILELEDKRRGICRLRKRVNRAVSGVPPRYVYQFTGTGPLE